jgi:ribose/xylose/arabinose/galactoside ABC-type transport system permease subunit
MTPKQKATLQKLGPFIALVLVSVGLAVLSPDFLTVANLLNVMRQVSINALIAFGMTLVILLGGIDLSVGSILALSSVGIATLIQSGVNPMLATLLGVIGGGVMGLLNGLVVSKGKVAPFIATLASMTILRGLAGGVRRQPDHRFQQRSVLHAGRRLCGRVDSDSGGVDADHVRPVCLPAEENRVRPPCVRHRR